MPFLIRLFRIAAGFETAPTRTLRVLIEVVHILIGLLAAVLIARAAIWSYPRATDDIWLVTYACMAAVVLMGIGPVRRAYAGAPAAGTRTGGDAVNG